MSGTPNTAQRARRYLPPASLWLCIYRVVNDPQIMTTRCIVLMYVRLCTQAVRRLDQALAALLAAGGLAAAAFLAVPASAGWQAFGVFIQGRILLGVLAVCLLYLRRPLQAFRQRFFSAEQVIG